MVLFKKKKTDKGEKPEFQFQDDEMDFPKYEPTIGLDDDEIKDAISKVKPVLPVNIIPPKLSRDLNGSVTQGKTLFVKIDKYKEVMNTLDQIKSKLEDSERILSKLTEIKAEEDKELEGWHIDLEDLKDKLLEVDRKLFEE